MKIKVKNAVIALILLGGLSVGIGIAGKTLLLEQPTADNLESNSIETILSQEDIEKIQNYEAIEGVPIPDLQFQPLQIEKKMPITPSDDYTSGGFCRVNYVESQEAFIYTFGSGELSDTGDLDCTPEKVVEDRQIGYAYIKYDTNLNELATAFFLAFNDTCQAGDSASAWSDDGFYYLTGGPNYLGNKGNAFENGMPVYKFDDELNQVGFYQLYADSLTQHKNDPTLAVVNNQVIISGLYDEDGSLEGDMRNLPIDEGPGTWYATLSKNLDYKDTFFLTDTSHISASSILFRDGIYYIITSEVGAGGSIIVMEYDEDWNFLGVKEIIENRLASWSQGALYLEDQNMYAVTYNDHTILGSSNIFLALFDEDWNLVSNTAITQFSGNNADEIIASRSWIDYYDGKLYLSYDVEDLIYAQEVGADILQCQLSVIDLKQLEELQ